MGVVSRLLILDEELGSPELAHVMKVSSRLDQERIDLQLFRGGFSQRTDHQGMVVGTGGFQLEPFE